MIRQEAAAEMAKNFINDKENMGIFSAGSRKQFADRQETAEDPGLFGGMDDMFDDFDLDDFNLDDMDLDFDLDTELDLDIPDDMADRIMAGAALAEELGGEHQPDEIEQKADEAVERIIKSSRPATAPLSNVIFARFGKYAASIAACFVLAVGMLTMSDPAGLKIIGVGEDPAATAVSEEPAQISRPAERAEKQQDGQPAENPDQAQSGSVQNGNASGTSGSTENASAGSSQQAAIPGGSAQSVSSTAGSESESKSSNGNSPAAAPVPSPVSRVSRPESRPSDGSSKNSSEGKENVSQPSENTKGSPAQSEPSTGENTAGNDTGNKGQGDILDNDPVKKVSDISELETYLGYKPLIPETPSGYSVSSVEIIYGSTVQIEYSGDNGTVIYRTAAGNVNLNTGVSYENEEEVDGYTLKGDADGNVRLVSWTEGPDSCSLSFESGIDKESAVSWAESVH